jgi:hypothetical protein
VNRICACIARGTLAGVLGFWVLEGHHRPAAEGRVVLPRLSIASAFILGW